MRSIISIICLLINVNCVAQNVHKSDTLITLNHIYLRLDNGGLALFPSFDVYGDLHVTTELLIFSPTPYKKMPFNRHRRAGMYNDLVKNVLISHDTIAIAKRKGIWALKVKTNHKKYVFYGRKMRLRNTISTINRLRK